MRGLTRLLASGFVALVLVSSASGQTRGVGSSAPAFTGARPAPWTNCTTFNRKYPHGVGRVGARDKTSGEPVTTFKQSTKLYNVAMSHNRGLDRDKDRIACEIA